MRETVELPQGRLTCWGGTGAADRPALIVCPGGSYEYCSVLEGAVVARAFAKDGFVTFVLEYDCAPTPLGRMPLHTLAAAVAWVRGNAARLKVHPDRIAVAGFSAGGHLVGTLGTVWNRPEWFAPGTDLAAHRPNAIVLSYPVITAGTYTHRDSIIHLAGEDPAAQQAYSLETLVDADTPPTFLWHTIDDDVVPVENTLLMEEALRKAGVVHEMHLFPHGAHGLSIATLDTCDPPEGRLPNRHIAHWRQLCAEWLKEQFA